VEEVSPGSPSATRLVSAGVPGPGVELPDAPSDGVAEIKVRSPSLASGYFGRPDLTRERFRDGTLLTSDLGFVRDGHLYPVGRLDDVISIAGRNVYTSEVESAVDELEPVRRGCSTIVQAGEGSTGRCVLLVELKGRVRDYQALAEDAAALARAKAALAIDECVILPKGSVPKTPSGKIQRHRCEFMLRSGRFDPLATVELAPA
jgi:fatty-acyl-CoA synthase